MSNPINYWYQKYQSLKAEMDKMMKGAVEGSVGRNFTGVQEISFTVYPDKYKDGDKVKIIIVKED